MRYKSKAEWKVHPKITDANGKLIPIMATSEDEHETINQAQNVCDLLESNGFAGEGAYFPLKTWVEPVSS